MIVTAWNNGSFHTSGAGYGLKIDITDRDRFFNREWESVMLELEGEAPIRVNIKKASFWGKTCHELIKKEIGLWLLKNRKAPWPKGQPPKFFLEPIEGNRFMVRG